jgi:hypothetical protein
MAGDFMFQAPCGCCGRVYVYGKVTTVLTHASGETLAGGGERTAGIIPLLSLPATVSNIAEKRGESDADEGRASNTRDEEDAQRGE